MEVLSFIVLILLSLVSYSGGITAIARKAINIRPSIADIITISIIWAGAVFSRLVIDFNKWLFVVIWMAISAIAGYTVGLLRKRILEEKSSDEELETISPSLIVAIWRKWKGFARKVGNFQNRVVLSLFYFVVVAPFAFAVKVLSDPLRTKKKHSDSYWISERETYLDSGEYRRQF